MLLIFCRFGTLAFAPATQNLGLCPKMTQLVTLSDKICQSEPGVGPFDIIVGPKFRSTY